MAFGGAMAAGWQSPPRLNPNYTGGGGGGFTSSSLMAQAGGGGNFGAAENALQKYFAGQNEAMRGRAQNLAAARGMAANGGVETQMEQEMANQLGASQAGALLDLYGRQDQQRFQYMQLAMQAKQNEEANRRYELERQDEKNRQQQLFQSMRTGGTAVPGAAQQAVFGDGQSSTGSISGGPAAGSAWDTRLGSERGLWAAPKKPTYAPGSLLETADQARARAAANPRSGVAPGGGGQAGVPGGLGHETPHAFFDYTGAGNTGGHLVPGIPTSGPSVTNLQNPQYMSPRR